MTYKQSINPRYLAKKMVMGYVKIIDPQFKKSAIKREVWYKAKKCAEKNTEEVLRSFYYHMDVRPRYQTAEQREVISLYKDVKQSIKNL